MFHTKCYNRENEVMPLKKNYTLDYSIERDTDRVAAVVDKLD